MGIINRTKYFKKFNSFAERKHNFDSLLVESYDYFFVSDLVVTTYFISNIDLILYTITLNYVCTCKNNINEEIRTFVCVDKNNKQHIYKFKKKSVSCKELDTNVICNILKILCTRNMEFELAFTGFYRYIADALQYFDKCCFTYKIFINSYKDILNFVINNFLSTDFITKDFVVTFFGHLEHLGSFLNDFLLVDFFVKCINDVNIAKYIAEEVFVGNLVCIDMLSTLLNTCNDTSQTRFDIKKFCGDLSVYHHNFLDLLVKTNDTLYIIDLCDFLELLQLKSGFSEKFYSLFIELLTNKKILNFEMYVQKIFEYVDNKTKEDNTQTTSNDKTSYSSLSNRSKRFVYFDKIPADNVFIYDVDAACSKMYVAKNTNNKDDDVDNKDDKNSENSDKMMENTDQKDKEKDDTQNKVTVCSDAPNNKDTQSITETIANDKENGIETKGEKEDIVEAHDHKENGIETKGEKEDIVEAHDHKENGIESNGDKEDIVEAHDHKENGKKSYDDKENSDQIHNDKQNMTNVFEPNTGYFERLNAEISYHDIKYETKDIYKTKDLIFTKLLTKILNKQYFVDVCEYFSTNNYYKYLCFVLFTNENCYSILEYLYNFVRKVLCSDIETHYKHMCSLIKELQPGLIHYGLEYFAREQEKHGNISTLASYCIAIYQDIITLSEHTKNGASDSKKASTQHNKPIHTRRKLLYMQDLVPKKY